MKTVLIISSFVSASLVGATASAFCLRRLGIEAIILPTTLMGRHPGWGNPGGGATQSDQLEAMWSAIDRQNIHFDAVLTGYMGDMSHVALAEKIIRSVKVSNPETIIMVDPVMGDHGALYIPQTRAEHIAQHLVPLADIITPNMWELSYLIDLLQPKTNDRKTPIEQAYKLAPHVLVTSVPHGDNIGAVLVETGPQEKVTYHRVSHKHFETVPHGGGDALAATYLAHILKGTPPVSAMEHAVASIFNIMMAANKIDAGELPLIREQNALIEATPLQSQSLNL